MRKLIATVEQLDTKLTATFNLRHVFIGIIILIALLGIAARIWLVHKKAQLHGDETHSFAIALSRNRLSAALFLEQSKGQWLKSGTLQRYLFKFDPAVNRSLADLLSQYKHIYWATAKDTHPPLYYFCLAVPSLLTHASMLLGLINLLPSYKWLGTTVNFIFFVLSSVFLSN